MAENLQEKLVTDVDLRFTKNEKILLETEKRSFKTALDAQTLMHDFELHRKLKVTQY
jgi:hypothetical protein